MFGVTKFTNETFSHDEVEQLILLLKEHGFSFDAARHYTGMEEYIGQTGVSKTIEIHTKTPSFYPGCLTRESILQGAQTSLDLLKLKSVPLYTIHAPDPDPTVSIEESIDAMQELHNQGMFKEWGLSNFTASQVITICEYCLEKKYILPTVYQGNYSLVARRVETELLHVLRSFRMRYHAYSPLAGGLLLSNPRDLADRKGRWDPETPVGKLFRGMYDKPDYHRALLEYADISEKSGIGTLELGYRWMVHHSKLDGAKGDGLIFGVSRFAQVKPTIEILKKGPLERAIVERLDGIWEIVRKVAPLDVMG